MRPAQLLLWDIDGTLLSAKGIFGRVLKEIIADVSGKAYADPNFSFAGKTDTAAIRHMLTSNGIGEDEIDAMAKKVVRRLGPESAKHRDELAETGFVYPGVVNLLHSLSQEPVLNGVLTGNIAVNAVLKLATFGLDEVVDAEIGAFGNDNIDRNALVEVAMKRVEKKYRCRFDNDEIWIIGDTPLDYEAARSNDLRCALVATGSHSFGELSELGADVVFEDFTDIAAVHKALFG